LSLLSESPELFYRIDSFIHLAFLRHLEEAVFPAVFSHVIMHDPILAVASLPYFTPDQLVQALTDYLSRFRFGKIFRISTSMEDELPLLASYASAVREPGRSWSERIVPFIPSNELNECEGWFLAWSVLDPSIHYAFAKINKEATEECQQRIDEFRESFNLPSHLDRPRNFEGQVADELDAKLDDKSEETSLSDELQDKENAIKSEYADREFHIFDVKSFFQELVKEGRPAPSPEALTDLLELFAFLEKEKTQLRVMAPAELNSFRNYTSKF
jgi:hypothetical protein